MTSAYEIRELELGDVDSLLATFHRVFGRDDARYRPRSREEWEWAFARNPAGRRVYVALSRGEVVAQYAALPSRVWCRGRETRFDQIVDSMVHPEHRAGLKRPGLFVQTAEKFFDAYGAPDRDVVHYGWPIEAAWRVGERFLGYEVVRPELLLARSVDPADVAPSELPAELPGDVAIETRFDEQVRWLYDRCVGAWGASTIRDAEQLEWRFLRHPTRKYTCLGARDGGGILRGLAVYTTADFPLPDTGVVVDWLVPPEEVEVGARLHRALHATAARAGAAAITTLIPGWSPWFATFQEWGWHVYATDYWLAARSFHPRIDAGFLREGWWYQLSDTDWV